MHDLDEALEYLFYEEGGWSDNKSDRGGKTMFGVTQGTYDDYRKLIRKPAATVRSITKVEARDLYDRMYWRAAGCHKLPWPISYLTFDAAVNSGVSRSVKWMQAGLGVPQDGSVGPATVASSLKAVEDGQGGVLLDIVDQRVQFLAALVKRDNSQLEFLLGWWRRSLRVLGRALTADLE